MSSRAGAGRAPRPCPGPGRGRPGPAKPSAWATASRLGRPVGHRRPRDQSGPGHGEVLVPTGQVEVAQGAALLRVLDDDDPPALSIAAAGGEAGRVEDAVEHGSSTGSGRKSRTAPVVRRVSIRSIEHGTGRLRRRRSTAPGLRWQCVACQPPSVCRHLSRCPLVVAPMAGGPSTVGFASSPPREAGVAGLPAGGYKTADGPGPRRSPRVRAATAACVRGEPLRSRSADRATPATLASICAASLETEAVDPGYRGGYAHWDDDAFTRSSSVVLVDPPPARQFYLRQSIA